MKTLLLVLSIFFAQMALGQFHLDTTVSKYLLDSLQHELSQKSSTINSMKWRYRLKFETDRIDTTQSIPDSTTINYRDKKGKLLYQELIKYRPFPSKQGYCKQKTIKRFFDENEKPAFIQYLDNFCYDDKDKDPDVKYFDAILAEEERINYDKGGRIVIRVTSLYKNFSLPYNTHIYYTYDADGRQTQTMTTTRKYDFWE